MRFAVLGDVLGNDRLLDEVLGELARRDIGASAVISMGNLVGRQGNSHRCLRMADGFAACLQGPLERALVHGPPDRLARSDSGESLAGGLAHDQAVEPVDADDTEDLRLDDLLEQFDPDDLHRIRRWPGMLLDPPYLFAGTAEQAQKLPESVALRFVASVGCFWLPGRPDTYLDGLRRPPTRESVETAWLTDYDDDHFVRREVIVPADGDEWELTVDGALPAVVHVGSVLGLTPQAAGRRIMSAWIVDDRFLRFRCWRQPV